MRDKQIKQVSTLDYEISLISRMDGYAIVSKINGYPNSVIADCIGDFSMASSIFDIKLSHLKTLNFNKLS